MKGLAILGSTGSVGTNVLRVVDAFPDRFRVVALAAGQNVERLAEQVGRHRPALVSVADAAAAARLAALVDTASLRVVTGREGMVQVATHPDVGMVVASAVGALGLVPTYAAIDAGKDVALANKETLVMAGELMTARAAATGARVLPIDSEHCALHQCLDGRRPDDVRRLLLTASGGPFRTRPVESFAAITAAEALQHPTWSMGRKITIDSATLMNKGLEVVEARWLFGITADRIEVLVHPQSVIHSLVEFNDGTVLSQLGVTDMRLPIQYALSYPECWPAAIPGLDWSRGMRLDFEPPDHGRFPCLGLAFRALEAGRSMPAVLNAANEEAVGAFLRGGVDFPSIARTIEAVMAAHHLHDVHAIGDVLEADAWARDRAGRLLASAATSVAMPPPVA